MRCIRYVQRRAEITARLVVAGEGSVEPSESKNNAAAASTCETFRLLLGDEGGAQDREDVLAFRVLGDSAGGRVDERNRGLDVSGYAGCKRLVDEDPRCLGAEPIVFLPRVRIRDLLDRSDSRREVHDTVDVAH